MIPKAQAELGGENAEQLARPALSVAEGANAFVQIARCRELLAGLPESCARLQTHIQ